MLIESVEKLAKKMQRGYFKKPTKAAAEKDTGEDYSVADRKRGNRRPMLTSAEKVDIVHQIVVQHKMVRDVAKVHRISTVHANWLVTIAKKKPKFIDEIFYKENVSAQKRAHIEKVVKDMVKDNEFIDSCKAVLKKVKSDLKPSAEASGMSISEAETRLVMRDMGMKYRKVKHIAMSANSQRSLVLR